MTEMYEEQVADGNYFLHGHQRLAASWQMDVMQKLMIPEWAGSWKLSLQLSSETDASFS